MKSSYASELCTHVCLHCYTALCKENSLLAPLYGNMEDSVCPFDWWTAVKRRKGDYTLFFFYFLKKNLNAKASVMRICVHVRVHQNNYSLIVSSLLTKLFKSVVKSEGSEFHSLIAVGRKEWKWQFSLAGKLINLFRWFRVPDVIGWIWCWRLTEIKLFIEHCNNGFRSSLR